jgi:hypothetical protein
MNRLIIALALVGLLASPAFGQTNPSAYTVAPHNISPKGGNRAVSYGTLLDDIALNGAASVRTFSVNNQGGGFAYLNMEVVRTRVAGTDLTLTCLSTVRESTAPTAQRTTCTFDANGACTSKTATLQSTTSSTETLAWTVNVLGWLRTTCVFASTSAGATDKLTVYANVVAQ